MRRDSCCRTQEWHPCRQRADPEPGPAIGALGPDEPGQSDTAAPVRLGADGLDERAGIERAARRSSSRTRLALPPWTTARSMPDAYAHPFGEPPFQPRGRPGSKAFAVADFGSSARANPENGRGMLNRSPAASSPRPCSDGRPSCCVEPQRQRPSFDSARWVVQDIPSRSEYPARTMPRLWASNLHGNPQVHPVGWEEDVSLLTRAGELSTRKAKSDADAGAHWLGKRPGLAADLRRADLQAVGEPARA